MDIKSLNLEYESKLLSMGLSPRRISTRLCFGEVGRTDCLRHALYLCEGLKGILNNKKIEKANRHIAAIQMCLSFACVYTLEELLSHNR